MKNLIAILFLTVSCVRQHSDKIINEPLNVKEISGDRDSILIDEFVFGRFCGECGRNCAPMFRLNTMGNISTLWADFDDNYFKRFDSIPFKTNLNQKEKLDIAYDIMWKLPKLLRDYPTNIKRFGCPDCTDGCGIYVEIKTYDSILQTKRFALDLYPQDKDSVPKEITAYANFINSKISALEK